MIRALLAVCALALTPAAYGNGAARGKVAGPTGPAPIVLAPASISPAGMTAAASATLGLPTSVLTAAPAPAETTQLSALVMSRMEAAGIEPRLAAERIAASRNVDETVAALADMGLIRDGETSQIDYERHYMLKRIWDEASPALLAEQLPIDRSWSVPAIKVAGARATYLIHPVAHGWAFAPNRREVLALTREIVAKSGALYSEQHMGAHYGFVHGKELNDHDYAVGPVMATTHGPKHKSARTEAFALRGTLIALYTGLAALAGWAAAHVAGDAGAAGVAAIAGAGIIFLLSGKVSLARHSIHELSLAWLARRVGLPDHAAQAKRQAMALHRRRLDPNDALRLTLPPGLANDPYAARTEAMVQAVLKDAGDRFPVVHILMGYAHAAHAAWRLKGLDAGPSDVSRSKE